MNTVLTLLSVNILGSDVNLILGLLLSLVIGFIIAFVVVSGWAGQLKSVRRQTNASSYKKADSLRLSVKKDSFLYTRVEKREKPQNNNNR
ncbi:MAG: hypothetical protein ACI4EX_13605 [Lachnospiraceae bacterium]